MNFDLKTLTLSTAASEKSDLLIVLVADGFIPGSDALSTLVAGAIKAGDLQTKAGKTLPCYQVPTVAARRVVLAGIGNGQPAGVRQGVQALAGALSAGQPKRALLCFATAPTPAAVAAAVAALAQASYVYTTTKPKAEARSLQRVLVGVPDPTEVAEAFQQSVAIATGVELAREWGNRPGNHATPTLLAHAAKDLAKQPNIDCKVLGPAEVAKLNMGAFMAVAQGTAEELRFIELRYHGAAKTQAPVVLVGKGITFDSGGISLKPGAEMDEMKFDMCGAASVLGVFQALAELQPTINVVGLIPACENLPSGQAIKPGDVVTSMSGQTIEILNTDAEGRLILCDALTYAQRFKPRAVIDIATLTGACVIALGGVRSGLFSPEDELAQHLAEAGAAALDPCWRMPLDEEYAEGLKSNFADMGNVGGRPAGAVTAAKFLQKFTQGLCWAHLDIAGVAWKSGAAKGATGRPVPLLVQYLLDEAARIHAQAPAKDSKPGKKTDNKKTAKKPQRKKGAA